MAGDILGKYGTNGQGLAITLASLADSGQRQSTVVDNTSNDFIDILASLVIKTGASGTSASGYVNVYVFGTTDGGTNYSDNAGATDAGITLTSPPNMRLVDTINAVANATSYKSRSFSLANAFGGQVPDHWGIVVENKTGHALDATEGSFTKTYQGIKNQYT